MVAVTQVRVLVTALISFSNLCELYCAVISNIRELSRQQHSRDRLEVKTLRCGRNNPGSSHDRGNLILLVTSVVTILQLTLA